MYRIDCTWPDSAWIIVSVFVLFVRDCVITSVISDKQYIVEWTAEYWVRLLTYLLICTCSVDSSTYVVIWTYSNFGDDVPRLPAQDWNSLPAGLRQTDALKLLLFCNGIRQRVSYYLQTKFKKIKFAVAASGTLHYITWESLIVC